MAEYARTLQVAYLAIHAANPAARVVMYGDPFWYDHGDYLRKLYPLLHRMDPGDRYHGYFDVANLHLYSNPAGMAGMIGWLRGELARYGWVNKQIWVGETNAEPYDDPATPRPRDNFRVSMGAQSSFMIDAFAELLAARVDRIEVYKMSDGADSDLGLVDCASPLRPFARTYAFMGRLYQGVTDGVVTQGDRVDGKAGIFKVVLRAPGRRITVLWNQGGDTRVYRLRLGDPHPVRYTKYGDARPIAVRSGAYTAVLGGNDDFTDPYDPRMPVVGGDPVIVVERTGR